MQSLLRYLHQLIGSQEDWLGSCLLCQQSCDNEPLLCSWCRQALYQPHLKCAQCGTPLIEIESDLPCLCGHCQQHPSPWQRLQVIGDYRAPYPTLIPRLKYAHKIAVATVLARLLADHLDGSSLPEVIIPVPLHWWRQWRRGFNQAEEIGLVLSKLINIPMDNNVLRRTKATPPQAQLTAFQRQHNLTGAFLIRPHRYRHVALLDDVVTTGATAGQLTELLHDSGVEQVEVWAICRTLKKE